MTNYDKGILKLRNTPFFKPTKKDLGNIKNEVKDVLIKKLGIKNKDTFEPQLLSREFSEVLLYDYYGNSYSYDPKLLNDKVDLLIQGSIGDTNNVYFGIHPYNYKLVTTHTKNINSMFENYKEVNNNGFYDRTPRSITVLSSQSEQFLQANKNSIESQIASFKENKELMDQTNVLNKQKTLLQNDNSMANLEYQSMQNMSGAIMSGIGGVMSMAVNPIAGAFSLGSTALNYFQSQNNLDRLKNQTEELNSLNLESVTLQALKSKTNFNQGLRQFNANLKDLKNQPDAIANIGNDLSFQVGNNLDDLYLDIKTPNIDILKYSYEYLKRYGVMQNKYYDSIFPILRQRKDYNYIKMTTVDIKNVNINQKHLSMFKNILISGVRVWNYREDMDFKNFNVDNLDNY